MIFSIQTDFYSELFSIRRFVTWMKFFLFLINLVNWIVYDIFTNNFFDLLLCPNFGLKFKWMFKISDIHLPWTNFWVTKYYPSQQKLNHINDHKCYQCENNLHWFLKLLTTFVNFCVRTWKEHLLIKFKRGIILTSSFLINYSQIERANFFFNLSWFRILYNI